MDDGPGTDVRVFFCWTNPQAWLRTTSCRRGGQTLPLAHGWHGPVWMMFKTWRLSDGQAVRRTHDGPGPGV